MGGFGNNGGPGSRTSFGAGVSMKWTFGGGFSFGAGVGVSQRVGGAGMASLNLSVNIYNSGVGTRSGVLGGPDKTYVDVALSPAATVALGNSMKSPTILNTFNNNAVSGVTNYYRNSITLGTNFVFNSHGRNQRVGFFGFKIDQLDFNTYNDVFPILGDRDDRYWTGGGSLNFGPFSLANDVFTGIRDKNSFYYFTEDFELVDNWMPDYINFANGKWGTYVQTEEERKFNNGQTLFLYRTRSESMGFYIEGSDQMWSQNMIHNHLSGNLLFYSKAQRGYGIIRKSSRGLGK